MAVNAMTLPPSVVSYDKQGKWTMIDNLNLAVNNVVERLDRIGARL